MFKGKIVLVNLWLVPTSSPSCPKFFSFQLSGRDDSSVFLFIVLSLLTVQAIGSEKGSSEPEMKYVAQARKATKLSFRRLNLVA